MYHVPHNFKAFYRSRLGRIVRRNIQAHINEFWPDLSGYDVMGLGYATPYLGKALETARRTYSVFPGTGGDIHSWPHGHLPSTKSHSDERNLICVASDGALPLSKESVDRLLVIHSLELSQTFSQQLKEIWRILKSNGRALIIVPNRSGWWAGDECTPFGHGTPFSMSQIAFVLKHSGFIIEHSHKALFFPPLEWSLILQAAATLERIGPWCYPFSAGVNIIEVSKHVYGATPLLEKTERVNFKGALPAQS